MIRFFSRPAPLVLALAFLTFIPILTALVETVQIPLGSYPEGSAHLAAAPVSWFLHTLTGVAFGVAGPLNLVRALRRRFDRLHRVAGWVFFGSGLVLGATSFALLFSVEPQRTPVVDISRGIFGLVLLLAIAKAIAAIRRRDIQTHRAWVIRAYAVGMGLGTVGLVFFPIYLVTGAPPMGLGADILFAASWMLNIGAAEWVVHRISRHSPRVPA